MSAFLVAVFIFAGCISSEKHTYESVREEYFSVVCDLEAVDNGGEGAKTCDLTQAVSLEDTIRIALKNNPDGKMATARIEMARAAVKAANATFYPYVGVYTEVVAGDAPSGYLFKKIDQRELPHGADFNDPGSFENFETGINASMNLFNGGADTLGREMAEAGLSVAVQDRNSVENRLVSEAINAYYNTLAAREFIRISEESVATVQSQLAAMRAKFKAGGALKSDLLSLEVRLARAKEDVLLSENRLKMSNAALANILGVNPNREIKLKTSSNEKTPIPETYVDGLKRGLENRPEILKSRERVRQTRIAVDAAKTGYLPKVDMRARYYMDDESMAYETDRDNWMVWLTMNWDVFTGFSTRASESKATAAMREILAADRKTVLALNLDIKNAYLKLDEARARLEVAQSSVAMARESLELVRKQYEGGAATITRYLEAELDRNRSEMRRTAAFYDTEKAHANVARAIGHWVTTREME